MNFAVITNILTMALCIAVLVQSVRMMRSLKAVKEGALTDVVTALDRSTVQARSVLSELKAALVECAGNARVLNEGKSMADELGVMIEIANNTAERLVQAAADANRASIADGAEADADASEDAKVAA
ncbi:DUF6468 domain-containing protein [Sphingomonas aerophila]|uniref:DUF6468 domain-containing protein n=1 Tax=Sphingomonas aerophila TaxID=1344948 RepID=A0A7W9BAK5_9SPHN|nr:DUF6468 domain-containing protein [Sphingomonas aerophila]MBB5713679.1 hypothetical protein [Sphingomonas aerophila]